MVFFRFFPSIFPTRRDTRLVGRQILPEIIEECKESAKCAAATKHFAHCQEKVEAGHGYKGEDCVEEMYVIFPFVP